MDAAVPPATRLMKRLRSFVIDLVIAGIGASLITAAFYGYAATLRYKAFTEAYLQQTEQISAILNKQINNICPEPVVEEPDEQ